VSAPTEPCSWLPKLLVIPNHESGCSLGPTVISVSAGLHSHERRPRLAAQNMLALSTPVAQIAKETGLSRQTIYRINEDPAASEAALTTWGL
jgi:hypothetical protein